MGLIRLLRIRHWESLHERPDAAADPRFRRSDVQPVHRGEAAGRRRAGQGRSPRIPPSARAQSSVRRRSSHTLRHRARSDNAASPPGRGARLSAGDGPADRHGQLVERGLHQQYRRLLRAVDLDHGQSRARAFPAPFPAGVRARSGQALGRGDHPARDQRSDRSSSRSAARPSWSPNSRSTSRSTSFTS